MEEISEVKYGKVTNVLYVVREINEHKPFDLLDLLQKVNEIVEVQGKEHFSKPLDMNKICAAIATYCQKRK